MFRFSVKRSLLACSAVFGLAILASNGYASFYYNVVDATTGATSENVTAANDSFTLAVYAVVTDSSGVQDFASDGILTGSASFQITDPVLKGNVSFGSFNTVGSNSTRLIGTLANGTHGGLSWTGANGATALGGTSFADSTSTNWYAWQTQGGATKYGTLAASQAKYIDATGGTLSSAAGAYGVEFYLGTIKVDFSAFQSSWGTLTADKSSTLSIGGRAGSSSSKPYNFSDANNAYIMYGSESDLAPVLVGNGSGNLALPNGAMTFTYTTSVNPNNAAALSAALGISGPSVGLGSTSLSVTGNVTNSGTVPANTLNWSSAVVGPSVTLTPSSGTVGSGSSQSLAGSTIPLSALGLGPYTSTVTITGSDGATQVNTTLVQPLKYSIIGRGAATGTTYGSTTLSTSGALASLAGVTSVSGTTYPTGTPAINGKTTAMLLDGSSSGVVSQQWRFPTSNELAGQAGLPLFSDVVKMGSGINEAAGYVVQMTYDPTVAANWWGGTIPAYAFTNGLIYLGYDDPNTGKWVAATGDIPTAAFQGTHAYTDAGVSHALGAYGIDTNTGAVWAVVDRPANSEFAVVPEPGTLALLAAGALALGFAYRRKVAKA